MSENNDDLEDSEEKEHEDSVHTLTIWILEEDIKKRRKNQGKSFNLSLLKQTMKVKNYKVRKIIKRREKEERAGENKEKT